MVVDAVLRATAKGGTTAAIIQVVITAAAATIAGAKYRCQSHHAHDERGCTPSEAAQSSPVTSTGDGMMFVLDDWCRWWWFLDYLVSSHWFSAVDRQRCSQFWREKKVGASGKGLKNFQHKGMVGSSRGADMAKTAKNGLATSACGCCVARLLGQVRPNPARMRWAI